MKKKVSDLEIENQKLKVKLTFYEKRFENIDVKYERIIDNLKEEGASSFLRLENFELELQKLWGKIEELSFYIKDIKDKLENISSIIDEKLGVTLQSSIKEKTPENKDELYQKALSLLEKGKFSDSRALFQKFINENPKDEKADDAQYYIGESYFYEKNFVRAIQEFQKVHDNYKKSDFLGKSLLKIGESFLEMKNCKKAKLVYEYALSIVKEKKERDEFKIRLDKIKETCIQN